MYYRKNNIATLIVTSLFAVLVSCKNNVKKITVEKQPQQKELINTNAIQYLKKMLTDSITKYSDSANVVLRDDSARYVLYINEVNNKKIAVIAITDSVVFLYQKMNSNWLQTDSFLFGNYAFAFNTPDLNGDHNLDLTVSDHGDIHGQYVPVVFLADKEGELHYRPDIQLYNIEYDSSKKLVKSYYQGGVESVHTKEYYRWQNDSLRFVRGVEVGLTSSRETTTIFYTSSKGKKKISKTVKDKDWKIFYKALWPGD